MCNATLIVFVVNIAFYESATFTQLKHCFYLLKIPLLSGESTAFVPL